MDNTQELVETLKAGKRIRLVLAKNEPVQNAHALFNRLERDHGLRIGRMPTLSPDGLAFVIWSAAHCQTELVGY